MGEYRKNYIKGNAIITGKTEQLVQILRITWDGDLISKGYRDDLVKEGLAAQGAGYNIITPAGIKFLADKKIITP